MKRIVRFDGLTWREEEEGLNIGYSCKTMSTNEGVLSRGMGRRQWGKG